MKKTPESINGRLQFIGNWKVQSGYGAFPLCKDPQSLPSKECSEGVWVCATVAMGEVINYHFEDEQV